MRLSESVFSLGPFGAPPLMGGRRAVEALADALFSLDEPWQGRFVDWVARTVTHGTLASLRPTREQVVEWFLADASLSRDTKLMLDTWRAEAWLARAVQSPAVGPAQGLDGPGSVRSVSEDHLGNGSEQYLNV